MRIRGVDIHVEDTGGSGAPVVFGHGLLWSGRLFAPQVEALRGRRRCVTFDFRGQGRTEVTAGGYDMDTLSEDAAAVIETVGAAPCHFAGLSMGGFIGMRLAARRPELLRSLTLIETAADPEPPLNRVKYGVMGALARFVGLRPFKGPASKAMFGAPLRTDPARRAERDALVEELLANDVTGVRRALAGVIHRKPIEPELGAIRCPTLVISGEADTSVTPARSRRTAEQIAGARFVTVPRAGHSSTLEEPAAVTRLLEEFLDSVDGLSSRT